MTARARATDKADDKTEDVDKPDTKSEAKADDKGSDDDKGSSGTAYLNTTNGPLVYDKDGHSVGGGEWTPEINLDATGKHLRQRDYLKPASAL